MDVLSPRTLNEALAMKADRPDARPIAGGTDVMVELNFDRYRPEAMIDISRLPELLDWRRGNGSVFLGAGVTYTRMMRDLPDFTALAQASRTVGSPQIRNRATVGGNLGTASPAGDALPVLAVYDAVIVLVRAGGRERVLPWHEFLLGVKKNALEDDELILGVRWNPVRGPGSFSKIGTRNAMVISVASLSLQVDEEARSIRVALGSVAPMVVRAPEAEAFAAEALVEAGAWDEPLRMLRPDVLKGFGDLVAGTTRAIDDVRGSARYRRHACAVLARRALSWALHDRREGPGARGGREA
ncbi:MAG: FAD binding domain-containing protein [Actinomycetota bacterium]